MLAAPLTVPMLAGAVLIGIASVLMTLPTAGDKGTAQQKKSYRWIVYVGIIRFYKDGFVAGRQQCYQHDSLWCGGVSCLDMCPCIYQKCASKGDTYRQRGVGERASWRRVSRCWIYLFVPGYDDGNRNAGYYCI